MATKTIKKTYHVQARLWAEVGVEVQADSLTEALDVSNGLKLADFITVKGDHNDSGYKITGVFEPYKEPVI